MNISEYVSLGHPDKIADYISEYILDKFIEKDPNTKYAVEVQIKDNFVTLGGEIKSNYYFSEDDIEQFVKDAVNEIGYTKDYQSMWGKENTICGDDLIITQHIGIQSPEIAIGLSSGWGDQGIMFGMAMESEYCDYMPLDYYWAKYLNNKLFSSKLGGLDIKTLVQVEKEKIKKVIVAIPLLTHNDNQVKEFVRDTVPGNYDLIINGTGLYTMHSSLADCGTTGRKLSVDFYGGNCVVGGGSPWTKDGSKADLTLNLYAREIALKYLKEAYGSIKSVKSSVSCCIGSQEIDVEVKTGRGGLLYKAKEVISPNVLIDRYKLNTPIFRTLCRDGLFSLL